MFVTSAFLDVENTYRREQLRRAWGGGRLLGLRRRVWATSRRHAHRPEHLARRGAVVGAR